MRVKATREGLLGAKTASGYLIDGVVPFVALPATKALGQFVKITNPATHKTVVAVVLDVGPWEERDEAYVFHGARPLAETGRDSRGRVTNHAGIDLGERIWNQLGMVDNGDVDWEFLLV